MIDEHDNDTDSLPLEINDDCSSSQDSIVESPQKTVRDTVKRDPVTGKFLPGTKAGPGRPKGRLDQLNVQVVSTLEALWSKRGAEIIDQLAAERPEVVAQLVARLIPTALAEQAITGSDDKVESNQEVTIRVVADQRQDVLPPREVVGELMHDDVTH